MRYLPNSFLAESLRAQGPWRSRATVACRPRKAALGSHKSLRMVRRSLGQQLFQPLNDLGGLVNNFLSQGFQVFATDGFKFPPSFFRFVHKIGVTQCFGIAFTQDFYTISRKTWRRNYR